MLVNCALDSFRTKVIIVILRCYDVILAITCVIYDRQDSLERLSTSLTALNVDERAVQVIAAAFEARQDVLRPNLAYLESNLVQTPSYHDLDWRFQVKTASRAVRTQMEPQVLLRLKLSDGGGGGGSGSAKPTPLSLTCTADNLLHLRDVLDEALVEAKSQHMQKLTRQLK